MFKALVGLAAIAVASAKTALLIIDVQVSHMHGFRSRANVPVHRHHRIVV